MSNSKDIAIPEPNGATPAEYKATLTKFKLEFSEMLQEKVSNEEITGEQKEMSMKKMEEKIHETFLKHFPNSILFHFGEESTGCLGQSDSTLQIAKTDIANQNIGQRKRAHDLISGDKHDQTQSSQSQLQHKEQFLMPTTPDRETYEKLRLEKLEEVSVKYLEVLKEYDVVNKNPKIKKIVEVLEEKRPISIEQLNKIDTTLKDLLTKVMPMFDTYNAVSEAIIRKRHEPEKTPEELNEIKIKAQKMADDITPWSSLKHLEIKVPDFVRKLCDTKEFFRKREERLQMLAEKNRREMEEADLAKKGKKEDTDAN